MSNIFYVNRLGQVDLSELESLFSLVGDVRNIRAEHLSQSSIGSRFGVIEMETKQQAADCIERFNGHEILGHRLVISYAKPVLPLPKTQVLVDDERRKKNGKR